MSDRDDDDPFDIPIVGEQDDEDDDDPFDIPVIQSSGPEEAPEESWMDTLLAAGQGAVGNVGDEAAGAVRWGLGKAGILPDVGNFEENLHAADAQMDGIVGRHPYAHAAGQIGLGVGAGLAAAPVGAAAGAGALASQIGAAGAVGAASELGNSHESYDDLTRAAGAGAVGMATTGLLGGAASKLGKAAIPRQQSVLKRAVTGGDDDAAKVLDQLLGGSTSRGGGQKGINLLTERGRALSGGGTPDIAKISAAAGKSAEESLTRAELQDLAQRAPQQMSRYLDDLDDLTMDYKGHAWTGNGAKPGQSPFRGFLGRRDELLSYADPASREATENALRQHAADTALSRLGTPATKSLAFGKNDLSWESVLAKVGSKALDKAAFNFPQSMGGTVGGMSAAVDGAGGALAGMSGPSKAGAQDKAYAGEPTLAWTLQSVLASGQTGLDPQDEQRLTEAVVEGDMRKIAAVDYQLKQRSPAYAKRIEDELRRLNEDEETP